MKLGKIHHYYDKIGVAALTLTGSLKVGDTVTVTGHGNTVTQIINSLQIEHQPIEKAKKGDDVAFKIDQPVKEGDEVEKA